MGKVSPAGTAKGSATHQLSEQTVTVDAAVITTDCLPRPFPAPNLYASSAPSHPLCLYSWGRHGLICLARGFRDANRKGQAKTACPAYALITQSSTAHPQQSMVNETVMWQEASRCNVIIATKYFWFEGIVRRFGKTAYSFSCRELDEKIKTTLMSVLTTELEPGGN